MLCVIAPCVILGCSETNGPDDTVTEIDICRDCADGRTIVPVYENGRAPLPGTRPIGDGDCEEWDLERLITSGGTLTGSDTITLPYRFSDDPDSVVYETLVPLSRTSVQVPCN